MSPTNTIRASVIQACTVRYDLDATLLKMERLVKVAKERDGSGMVVFPEAFIGGYPKGQTFGCVIGERHSSGRQDYLDYHNAAVTIPGPAISRIEKIARESGVLIVSGVIEKEKVGGSLFCTVVWVHPEGGLIGKRRKLMPTASERLVWAQGDASDAKLVRTTLPSSSSSSQALDLNISATICWENYMPLFRQHLYDLGTQIYCAPTVDGREVWANTMVHIALEGRCFVLSANQFSQAKDHVQGSSFTAGEASAFEEDVKIAGGSMIVDPMGTILAGPLRGQEGVLTAELDLDTIIRGKFDLDVSGHYARNDIFQLNVRDS